MAAVDNQVKSEWSTKYYATAETLKSVLAEYGVAVIPNVLDAKECAHMENGMWNYLETVSREWKTPMKRSDSKTWTQMTELFPLHSMLLKQFGIGHTQMSWDLRQNPKVIKPFSTLWSVESSDLLCSFDGASFLMPPEVTGKGWSQGSFWWHTDQSYTRNQFECVQSWVTAFDVKEGDATLAVLEKSHKYHGEFAKQFDIRDTSDWFKLTTDEHLQWYQKKGCSPVHIHCPAGSMVFWDSRTIHCGTNAVKGRVLNRRAFRCIAYICMTRRQDCTEANLKKRIEAFNNMRTTNHWPHKPKLNPTTPRLYDKTLQKMTPLPKPKLTALGYRLVGFHTVPLDAKKSMEEKNEARVSG